MLAPLPHAFYARDTRVVARDLLGKLVVRRLPGGALLGGRVVETEAYHGPRDRASHAHGGPTPRAAIMFGPPGFAYIYLIYGMYHCLNVVTGPEGFPAAVLVRALAAVPGLPFAGEGAAAVAHDPRVAAGPGKLCRALAIGREHNGIDLALGHALWLADDGATVPRRRVATGPRIGVDYAGASAARPWRYWIDGEPAVSRSAPRRFP